MGLDMYLSKKTYVKYWEHKGDDNYEVKVTKGGNPTNIDPKKVSYVTEEVGYWRKANQIHDWFVKNVQDGVDDCRNSFVSREKLQELLDICRIVAIDKSKAEDLLPTASGFFFGGTEYDEWYYEQIDETIQILEEALSDENADEFEYHSSW
jgi:hypothetical protein